MTTIGTMIYTWLNGELVGTDEFGNRYYSSKRKKLYGEARRWVLYKGTPEGSKVPAEWHSWLHRTTGIPLTEQAAQAPSWQKPHEQNPSGSVAAYRPQGHDLNGGNRSATGGDYEAWSP
jgi:NADH:ubiquinone oxidoreductase subunit